MAPIPAEVKLVVEEYVRNISRLIPVKKAVLFGSYAKGYFFSNARDGLPH